MEDEKIKKENESWSVVVSEEDEEETRYVKREGDTIKYICSVDFEEKIIKITSASIKYYVYNYYRGIKTIHYVEFDEEHEVLKFLIRKLSKAKKKRNIDVYEIFEKAKERQYKKIDKVSEQLKKKIAKILTKKLKEKNREDILNDEKKFKTLVEYFMLEFESLLIDKTNTKF